MAFANQQVVFLSVWVSVPGSPLKVRYRGCVYDDHGQVLGNALCFQHKGFQANGVVVYCHLLLDRWL